MHDRATLSGFNHPNTWKEVTFSLRDIGQSEGSLPNGFIQQGVAGMEGAIGKSRLAGVATVIKTYPTIKVSVTPTLGNANNIMFEFCLRLLELNISVCVCVYFFNQDHHHVLELLFILFTIFVCNCIWHIYIFRCTCIQYKVIDSFGVSLESNGPPLSAPQEGASLPSSKLRRLVVLGATRSLGCMIHDHTWYILLVALSCHAISDCVCVSYPLCLCSLYVLSLQQKEWSCDGWLGGLVWITVATLSKSKMLHTQTAIGLPLNKLKQRVQCDSMVLID